MKIVPLRVVGKNCSIPIHALLDEGSTVSLINDSIVKRVGADSKYVNVSLRGIGENEAIAFSNKRLSLSLEGDNFRYHVKNLLSVQNLALPFQNLPFELTKICAIETGIQIASFSTTPDLLIGQDNIDLILTRNFIILKSLNMIVSQCLLGWSLHGNFTNENVQFVNSITCSDVAPSHSCCKKMKS